MEVRSQLLDGERLRSMGGVQGEWIYRIDGFRQWGSFVQWLDVRYPNQSIRSVRRSIAGTGDAAGRMPATTSHAFQSPPPRLAAPGRFNRRELPVPDQIAGWMEFLQSRVLVNREALVFASIVFFQVFLTIINVIVLFHVARTLGALRRTVAESQFRAHELHEEVMRRMTQDREAFAAIGERLDKVGDERKSKTDERRRILRTLVDGFEATLSQRR